MRDTPLAYVVALSGNTAKDVTQRCAASTILAPFAHIASSRHHTLQFVKNSAPSMMSLALVVHAPKQSFDLGLYSA